MAGRDGVLLDPAAGSELVEVVARFACRIKISRVEHGRVRKGPTGGRAIGNVRKRGNNKRAKSEGPEGAQNISNRMHLRTFEEGQLLHCRACGWLHRNIISGRVE